MILPFSGEYSPAITFRSVVFPAPLGPISPSTSPFLTVKVTSFNAVNPPKRLLILLTDRRILLICRTMPLLFKIIIDKKCPSPGWEANAGEGQYFN